MSNIDDKSVAPSTNGNGRKYPQFDFSHFGQDFTASLVVFLVALPLCIGIANAVGVPPALALMTGIVGGVVVGLFAGSPLQVSGPAAGLFVIVADLIADGKQSYLSQLAQGQTPSDEQTTLYSLMVLGTSVFLAGILQVVAGRLYLGQWFRAVSPAVIKGMLAGIGILIVVSQFHTMLDHTAKWEGKDAHGGLQYMATIPEAISKCFSNDVSEVPDATAGEVIAATETGTVDEQNVSAEDQKAKAIDNHHTAALIGIITIATIVIWPVVVPKQLKVVPAALVGIFAAAIAAYFAAANGHEVRMLTVEENIFKQMTLPDNSTWYRLLLDPLVLKGAIVIALVASAETLLCATAVDQLHNGERTNYDKELSAQGVGNMLCGLIGALPMTGVIVRSSANVGSGAKTRLSAIMHGFWLLIFVVAVPSVLAYIPKAALGALLVHIGIKLVNIKIIRELWKTSRGEVLIYIVTTTVIVVEDLLVGVLVGILLSAGKLLYQFSHLELDIVEKGGKTRLQMEGAATFLRLPHLAMTLDRVPDSTELHIDFKHLTYIDHACLDLLMNWAKQHEGTGGKLVIDWSSLQGRFTEDPKEKLVRAKSTT